MDYGYFAPPNPPAPYQFLGLPPTPAHTNSAHSDEPYGNGSSPEFQERAFPGYDNLNGHQFEQLDGVLPNAKLAKAQHRNSTGISISNEDLSMLVDGDHEQGGRSSSDEKETLTPAQSRRKAQNRTAQRAFRERKERHVKDLEVKLNNLEQTSNSLVGENERLKRELQKAATENEILRATSSRNNGSGDSQGHGAHGGGSAGPPVVGPMRYSPTDFYSNVLQPHKNKSTSHRITVSDTTGERLLSAGATWDLIQQHPLYEKGLFDVGDVCERIKGNAKCDGQGPVFDERDVREAIEASVASGRDELI